MVKMVWRDAYSTGIRVIDEDHKMLFSIINNLVDEIDSGSTLDSRKISSVLEALNAYVASHFTREERFLEQFGYPELANHRHSHDALRNQLGTISNDYRTDPDSIDLQALSMFLMKWLSEHILKSDMDYVPYLLGKKTGVPSSSRSKSLQVTVSVPKDKTYLITEFANELRKSRDSDMAVKNFYDAYFNGDYKK